MLPEKTFENRVGIITGGGTGIGFAIARELAKLGATVIIARVTTKGCNSR